MNDASTFEAKQVRSKPAAKETPDGKPSVVLVVDDEPAICWGFQQMLEADGHEVLTASSAEQGLAMAGDSRPDLVLLDVRLPREDGISALPKFIAVTSGAPVIVMTAFGDLETAVAAVRNGASDYLTKPFRLDEAQRICRVALRSSGSSVKPATPTQSERWNRHRIVGQSPAIQQAYRQIALVAASDLSVLITGETGTGKELVAAAIHRHSRRSQGPYLPVAPVALNPDLIESELFGHVHGAFTGATSDRVGLFERAEGGTVLLDEIGDLPLSIQVKLLRVLEHGEYCRVGEVDSRSCDVRILAATNTDLHAAVREGRFREDLFYRINGLQIHLPPLRNRVEDVRPLCDHFLQRFGYESTEGVIDDALMEELKSRPWHGNVRELRNAIEHAAVVARGRPLTVEDFPPEQPGRQTDMGHPSDDLTDTIAGWTETLLRQGQRPDGGLHAHLLSQIEPTLLRLVLQHTAGNRAKAAELLGIHRGTLREKLRGYGLEDFPTGHA